MGPYLIGAGELCSGEKHNAVTTHETITL